MRIEEILRDKGQVVGCAGREGLGSTPGGGTPGGVHGFTLARAVDSNGFNAPGTPLLKSLYYAIMAHQSTLNNYFSDQSVLDHIVSAQHEYAQRLLNPAPSPILPLGPGLLDNGESLPDEPTQDPQGAVSVPDRRSADDIARANHGKGAVRLKFAAPTTVKGTPAYQDKGVKEYRCATLQRCHTYPSAMS